MSRMHLSIFLLAALALCAPLAGQQPDTTGTGWRLARLDLDVTVHPDARRLALAADLVLRLADHERSSRIVLALNSRDTTMAFDSVTAAGGVVMAMNSAVVGRAALRQTVIDLSGDGRNRGDEIRVKVHASSRSTWVQQFVVAPDIALASWVTAWYPVPLPGRGGSLSTVTKAPGETRFDIPLGWRVVSNGVRTESRVERGRMVERWATEQPLARSFAAAPYRVVEGESGGNLVELFLLTVSEAEARVQADALARSIAALERRFGPYPTGSYAIAEVPEWVPGFIAASEQGFMMAKPETFQVPGGNIPLFAHEAAHGYWGNLVGSNGPGSAFLEESIAQYGAVIALEDMLGADAAVDFLKFSREGYIPLQSARGFFEVIRRGADSVAIADMSNLSGMAKRIVVDSKGTWIYHMLRQRLGDELFFSTLRSYLELHADGSSTLIAFREHVTRAAPDAGLESFFAQWLDRTGAPRLEVSWTLGDGHVNLVIVQTQQEEPYMLDLDVLVEGQGGSRRVHTVHLDRRRGEFRLPVSGQVIAVTVDPNFKILRWDEVYVMNER